MMKKIENSKYEENEVVVKGDNLTINDVVRVARCNAKVRLSDDEDILRRINASHDYIVRATEACRPKKGVLLDTCKPIYGITTGFGGMANTLISPDDAGELQENLIWFMKTDTGKRLSKADIRAAMLIRANNHMIGISGLRYELVKRIETFLNANITPHVC